MAHAADVQFTLTTNYTGLYPDADVSVPVTVHNPAGYDLAVHTADVRVGDANPGCPAANLEASSYSGDVVAPPHGDADDPDPHAHARLRARRLPGRDVPAQLHRHRCPRSASQPGRRRRGDGGFAFTGADSWTTTLVGVGALVAGLALIGVRRRRPSEMSS